MAHKYDYPSGGKGDTRIMPQVSDEEFARRWAATFGQNAPSDADRPHSDGLTPGNDPGSSDSGTDPVDLADQDAEEEG